jgi:hypothetical protein
MPVIIATVVLGALAGLMFWDSARQDSPAPSAAAIPVATDAQQPARVTNVSTDEDFKKLSEPPMVEAVFVESHVTQRGLTELNRFSGVRSVELDHVRLNDAAIATLRNMQQIERLILTATGVNSQQVISLTGCDNLRELGLQREKLDPSSLMAIARMKQLKSLYLDGSSIDDQALDYLRVLPNLSLLSLASTPITSEGAAKLEKFEQVRVLSLASTKIGKAALDHLARMPRLEVLHLQGTHIGPRCLNELKQLKQVRVLEVSNRFGTASLIILRHALPQTLIYNVGDRI